MALTYFYAAWFGVFLSVLSLAMLVNRRAMMGILREVLDSRAILFVIAIVGMIMGVLVVLTHNVWNQGAVALIVTLIGWLLIARSVLIFFLPHGTIRKIFTKFTFEQTYYTTFAIVFIVGLYLSWNGFFVYFN